MRFQRGLSLAAAWFLLASTASAADVRIAVCQILSIDGDREGNFRRIEYALEDAKKSSAEIAAFPESAILGWENPDAHQMAAPIPGADSERIVALARKYGMMISIGLDEKDGDSLYGAAILVDKDGKLLLKHRKINVLPQLMSPPYSTGKPSDIQAVETAFGRIGIVICADTFVDEYAQRVAELKADLMLVPYGWAAEVQRWPNFAKSLERLVAKRAGEWRCPVVGTDNVGAMSHGPWRGRTYGGASVVAGADGKIVAVLRDRDVEVQVIKLRLGRLEP